MGDGLALAALVVLERLHGLCVSVLPDRRNIYLEGGGGSNGLVGQGSMVSLLDLLIGIP